ncbi:SGNH hydrolase [Sporormia fimetaria CBS 119925]|uniref:SGNH hydrolase n=1 Tax=Sporormia fimetaria CBS 119925 TaxID=1340428 RepID=A0A6A6V4S1_9PLEO|nr:SGNH hydrolase [Sporormia fimetaria CBS 119925]
MPEPKQQKQLPQIVLFGASLTQWSFNEHDRGFGWVLTNKYEGKAEVVNEGVAGYTSTLLRPNFDHLIQRCTAPSSPSTLLITIFLGANDACLIGPESREYVPLSEFESNLREFVEKILVQDNMPETRIVLMSPPPINIRDPASDVDVGVAGEQEDEEKTKKGRGYQTYTSKRRYAEKVMEIARSYEETGRVVGCDIWKALIDEALEEHGRGNEREEERYDVNRLPGCGLRGAREFREGYFTDGLHFGALGYGVVGKKLLKVVLETWPDLEPEKLGN